MKKVLFTSILLLSAVSFGGNIYAQNTAGGNDTEVTTTSESSASVEFNASEDGKTLTISGYGDLTSYRTTDRSAKVFTDNAVGFVFTDADGKTPVAAGESYNAGKTYYQADYKHNKVWENEPVGWNTYFNEVTSKKEWKEDKIANLYHGYIDWQGKVVLDYRVSSSSSMDNFNTAIDATKYPDKSQYFISTGDVNLNDPIGVDELDSKGVSFVSFSELNEYANSDVTYQVKDVKLFLSTDGGKTFKGLTSGINYKWTSGDVFYQGTATYAAIKDNNAFFDKMHTDYVQADNTEISFTELLRRKILEGVSVYDYNAKKEVGVSSYTTVKFVNNGSDPLLIDADVVREILYPTSNGMFTTNVTTTKLDLGEATLNELNADIFIPSHDESYKCHKLALNDITFPKTKLTSVFSESTKHDENKMVLPAQLLSNITGYIKTVSIPEGYDRIADGAFSNENAQSVLENVNLPKGLTLIGKNAFQDCKNIKSIELNEGLENIGESAFSGTTLETVKFPSSLKIINDCAFVNCKIENLKFNQGLEFIGNSAFGLSNSLPEEVLDIPSSVKYIGPSAFNFRQYQDVYFHGKKAPLMPLGESLVNNQWSVVAFTTQILHGNNGFNPAKNDSEAPYADNIRPYADNISEGKANRENYINGGVYFAMLHYPTGLDDEARAEYTDITRKYETLPEGETWYTAKQMEIGKESDEVLNEVTTKWGNWFPSNKCVNPGYRDTYVGRQYIWPSQSQFMRSFCMNYMGYNWYGDTKYRSKLSKEDKEILAEAGYRIGTAAGEYTEDELAKIAHLGTRLFVFTGDDATATETPDFPLPITEGGRWWTLCVPFNMTKKMVDKAMGVGTQVCRFSSVTRKLDTDGRGRGDGNKGNHIYLEFRHDVYKHKFERNTTDGTFHDAEWSESLPACGDDDIVIYAHEAYMVKPTKTDKNPTFVVDDYEPVPGSPLPTIIKATETRYTNNTQSHDVDDNAGEYRFIGNYINTAQRTAVSVPVNCYFYGLAKASDTKPAFWFWPYNSHLTWPSYKCTVETVNVELGEQDACDFFNFVAGFSASSKYQSSFFGDDELYSNETTSVDQVVIVAGDDNQAIYNLSGQLVSKNGNLDGLQKGVYVKGGKKFIVK